METPFDRWLRAQTELDSRKVGIVVFDCDIIVHRYKTIVDINGSRMVECLMLVEVKTRLGALTEAQQDTLLCLSQVARNRKATPTSKRIGDHAEDHAPPATVWSHVKQRNTHLRMFGVHVLRMNGDDPKESSYIEWDGTEITIDTLLELLAFDLDPDTLKPLKFRRHHRNKDCKGKGKLHGIVNKVTRPN